MKWIDCRLELPDSSDFGNSFLCCIKCPSGYEYEVAEWFDPLAKNEKAIFEHEYPHFLINNYSYTRDVVAWFRFDSFELKPLNEYPCNNCQGGGCPTCNGCGYYFQ